MKIVDVDLGHFDCSSTSSMGSLFKYLDTRILLQVVIIQSFIRVDTAVIHLFCINNVFVLLIAAN